jgi:digeranylgeranylglycerophospholipid reductase
MTRMADRYDVVVVGAGPAGASAALEAATAGARVLVAERKAVPGVPVRCAEHIPALLLREIPGKPDFIVQSVTGMRTHLPDGRVTETKGPGYIIDRARFDQTLVRAAAEAGAEIRTATRAVARHPDGLVLRQDHGAPRTVRAGVIVGADGPRSLVGRWIESVNPRLIPALQVRLPLRRPLDATEIFFHPDFVGAYGWLFPRGESANVGLGICPTERGLPPLAKTLRRFVDRLAALDRVHAKPLQGHFGWIPAGPVRSVTAGNIVLAGDAAGQTHAITGAGVPQAVICGRMAGRWAARAARENDLSLLEHYEAEWRDLFEETLSRAHRKRQLLESRWSELQAIVRSCWVAYREYHATPV